MTLTPILAHPGMFPGWPPAGVPPVLPGQPPAAAAPTPTPGAPPTPAPPGASNLPQDATQAQVLLCTSTYPVISLCVFVLFFFCFGVIKN